MGRVVNELGLPRDALVNVLVRDEEALLPRGSTQIEAGDRLHILVRQKVRADVEGLFQRWRDGPIAAGRAGVRGSAFPPGPVQRAALARGGRRPGRARRRSREPPSAGRCARAGARRDRWSSWRTVATRSPATGIVAVGGARQVFRYCRERIGRAEDAESRAWWQEVAGVLSQRALG